MRVCVGAPLCIMCMYVYVAVILVAVQNPTYGVYGSEWAEITYCDKWCIEKYNSIRHAPQITTIQWHMILILLPTPTLPLLNFMHKC